MILLTERRSVVRLQSAPQLRQRSYVGLCSTLDAVQDGAVRTLLLHDIELAIRASWSAETAAPEDRPRWTAENPAFGQCGVTALVVHDLLGGDLVRGEVHRHRTWIDYHWWNRLSSGVALDLTREQFIDGETVVGGDVVVRPPDHAIRRCRDEYELLRTRVLSALTIEPAEQGLHST